MTRLYPDHPAGPQSMAATLWLQELNRSRHLQASLYSTESVSNSEDKVDPRLVGQFRQWIRTAKTLAEARLRRNPRDVEARSEERRVGKECRSERAPEHEK